MFVVEGVNVVIIVCGSDVFDVIVCELCVFNLVVMVVVVVGDIMMSVGCVVVFVVVL